MLVFKVPSRHAASTVHLTRDILSKLFRKLDENHLYSLQHPRLTIEYTTEQFDWIRPLVDEFLTPRPWYFVSKETYPFYKLPHDYGSFPFAHHNHSHFYEIAIDTYPRVYYPFYRHLASVQYLENSDCEQVPILFNRYNPSHPGWASVLSMYAFSMDAVPYGVNTIYVSHSNRLDEDTSFITSKYDCPDKVNKWECAFLPSTNCTVPFFIRNITKEEAIFHLPETFYYTVVFTNFTEQAVLLDQHNPVLFKQYEALQMRFRHPVTSAQNKWAKQLRFSPPPRFHYITSQNKEMRVSAKKILRYNFMLRHNAFYRHEIDSLLASFYQKNHLSAATECIAVHVRRGDRVFYGENMTEYCARKDANTDFGCGTLLFSEITLEKVLKGAEILTSNRAKTLFVATDDPHWLREALQQYGDRLAPYKVYSLALPDQIVKLEQSIHNKETYDRYNWIIRTFSGTTSGVYLFGTIKLLQQCSSFIGHFGSETADWFYDMLCYRHGNGKYAAVCPPVFDLRALYQKPKK